MSMLSTIALVVIFAAVTVLFSTELQSLCKKLINNKFIQLVVPLIFMSWFVVYFDLFVSKILISCRIFLFSLVYYLSEAIPGLDFDLILEKATILILFSLVPLLVAMQIDRRFNLKIKANIVAYWVSIFFWSIIAIVFVVGV